MREELADAVRARHKRSPSCGVKQRYDGTFTGTLVDGAGVTAQLLMENGFRVVDVEDLPGDLYSMIKAGRCRGAQGDAVDTGNVK